MRERLKEKLKNNSSEWFLTAQKLREEIRNLEKILKIKRVEYVKFTQSVQRESPEKSISYWLDGR